MPRAVLRLHIVPMLACAALGGAVAFAAPSTHTSSEKGIAYRWVDEQGVVHYGDHIPPQYATQDRTILNSQGVEVGHLEAQKSPEQQAAEARARAEAMKQKQHDAFLVTTYTSVKDIEHCAMSGWSSSRASAPRPSSTWRRCAPGSPACRAGR